MLYVLLRAAARVALQWYYAEVVVQGADRIPPGGPLIIAANHPNALVDAMVVATVLRRRILMTAKATLFEHPVLAWLFSAVGVVPLRRASDERAAARRDATSPSRNRVAFEMVTRALVGGRAVLVFPEGISHDRSSLAPLKSGAARMALEAHAAGASEIRLLPVGLIFERKERPRSRVLMRVGEPIAIANSPSSTTPSASELTATLDVALKRVTLNFATDEEGERAVLLAKSFAAIVDPPPALSRPRDLATEAELSARIEDAMQSLSDAPPSLVVQADALIARMTRLEARLASMGASLDHVRISPRLRHGAWFVARELGVLALAFPIALLGRIAHWIPLRVARALALRTLASDPSRDQPAMRTIVLGAAFVVGWYVLQGVLMTRWISGVAAVLWLVTIFLAARVDFLLRDRIHRGWQRARTYLALRAHPDVRADALREMESLTRDAVALEQALRSQSDDVTRVAQRS